MSRPMESIRVMDLGLLLIRGMVGVVFAFHGAQKLFGLFEGPGIGGFTEGLDKMGFPFPVANAWLVAIVEFFGGLALIVGFCFYLFLIPLIITMLVAAFVVHGGAFSLQHGGMEFALTLGVVMIGLAFTGPGTLSLSKIRATRRGRSAPPEQAAKSP